MHQCVKDTFNGKVTKTDITNSVLAKVRNSGDGDGEYDVYVEKSEGKIVAVEIHFI